MNSDLLSIKLKFKSIVKDIISAYGLNQEGKWIYVPSNDNSYYDLIVNNRLGAFKYKLKIEIHLNRKNGDTYVPKEILEE